MRDPVRRLLPAVVVSLAMTTFTPGLALAQSSGQESGSSLASPQNTAASVAASPTPSNEDRVQAPAPASGSQGGAGFGILAGVTLNTFSGPSSNFTTGGTPGKAGRTMGWSGGFFVGGNRSHAVGLESGLLYVLKGGKDPSGTKAKLHYFEVPVLVRFNGGSKTNEGMSFYGQAGIGIDILDASDVSPCQIPAGAPATTPCATRQHFVFQGSELELIVGGGIEIHKFIVQVRGEFGLRDVYVNTALDGKNRNILVLAGWRLN